MLQLPGVSARKISDLDAYFVSDKMFACISGDGVGLRLPAAVATELQFSRSDVVAFQPRGPRAIEGSARSRHSGIDLLAPGLMHLCNHPAMHGRVFVKCGCWRHAGR